jgi:hypothetical protein
MDLKKTGWHGVDWIYLTPSRGTWPVPSITALNFGFLKCGEFLEELRTVRF